MLKPNISKWHSSILMHIFKKLNLLYQEKNGIFQVIKRVAKGNLRRFGLCVTGKKNVSSDPT
jgi:hypothetical protein